MEQAESVDRYAPCLDDEVGHSWLTKQEESGWEASGVACAGREEGMAVEIAWRSREHGSVNGDGLRRVGLAIDGGLELSHFDGRRMASARAAYQAEILGPLDEIVVLSGPLLPRPGLVLDYLGYLRGMVESWESWGGFGRRHSWAERLVGVRLGGK